MNRLKAVGVVLFFVMLVFAPVYSVAADPAITKVAQVGNVAITVLDVQREMQKLIPMQMSFHSGLKKERLQEIAEEALNTLIDRAYKVQYAISEEIAVDPQVLAEKWKAFKTTNVNGLAKLSAEQVEKLRADIYLQLLAEKSEDVAVKQRVAVTDEEVTAYYQKNKGNYVQPKLYKASQIFVKVDPSSREEEVEERRQRAAELLKRAKAGEDFYNLAYYESDDRSKYVGGSLGSFHAGQTVEEFDQAINVMKPGEISDLVRTMYGFHIIKLDEVTDERPLSFDEASALVRQTLERNQRDKIYEQWMDDNKAKFELQRFE
jgi:parvulin-like peptidyl-prolyl isomerase